MLGVRYYRPIRSGPEAILEATVVRSIDRFLTPAPRPRWIAASLPIGAGIPDLIAISWAPEVVAIANRELSDASLLAYLRAVGCARFDTIVKRLGRDSDRISASLSALVEADIVTTVAGRFSLARPWRQILPDVTAIEAKISNWQRAIDQAARNQLFCHRSFVALPERIAWRASESPKRERNGVGVLSVSPDGTVSVLSAARVQQPRLWAYYYKIAQHLAQDMSSTADAVSNSDRAS